MRFTLNNWEKFFDGSNKVSTIRLKKSKVGHTKAFSGSYYRSHYLGEFDIISVEAKTYGNLTDSDAVNDGFPDLWELRKELIKINGMIQYDQIVFIHKIKNVKRILK